MELPCVQAPGEGEAQAAYMAAMSVVNAVYSNDYDAFLFGSPLVVRGTVERFKGCMLQFVLRAAGGITLLQLIGVAVIAGTDFNVGVKGLGIAKAVKLIKKFGSLEDTLKFPGVEEKESFLEARRVFLEPDVTGIKVIFSSPNTTALERFAEEKLSRENAENIVRRLKSAMTKQERIA